MTRRAVRARRARGPRARRGFVRSRFTAASATATASSAILARIVLPYEVSQRAAKIGKWMTVAAIPEPSTTITETKATFENLGTQTASAATRRSAGTLRQRTSRPTRPPSHTEPAARWSQSTLSERPRGAVSAAWPARPGIASTVAAAANAPAPATSSATERRGRSGRSTQRATAAAATKNAKQISRST